jgi:NMD protein affecting ribosome stability and mRNA decay
MKQRREPRHEQRGDRRLEEQIHDPYKARDKLSEPSRCPQCGAVFSGGRWSWTEAGADAAETTCPACRRINDRYPAGELILSGAFVRDHEEELLNLLRNSARAEQAEHPLHRIMDVEHRDDDLRITTTDIHLPRRLGHALEAAWDGELTTHYDPEGYSAHVAWKREQ